MTYSIVAVDKKTGDIGVAVQTHNFSVSHWVPFVEAGVGAVATQAFTNRAYGENGLRYLAQGLSPHTVLERILSEDPDPSLRQVGIIDKSGVAVAHSGSRCFVHAGHTTGPFYSIQANLMRSPTVWPAMETAFLSSAVSPLPERLLTTLDAAEAEGGDLRGKQSASLVVKRGIVSESCLSDTIVELHVYDHPEPLRELRRLLMLHRAYSAASDGYAKLLSGDSEGATSSYEEAYRHLPDNPEILFWHAHGLIKSGSCDAGMVLLKRAIAADECWRELALRMIAMKELSIDSRTLVE